mgnify:CR=1 FL=1
MLITHDLGVIAEMADEVVVMYAGKVIEKGTVDEIFYQPKHPYTKALLSAIPIPDANRKRDRIILEGDVPSAYNPPSGCKFHTRCPYATEKCRTEVPKLRTVGEDHMVACHRDDL